MATQIALETSIQIHSCPHECTISVVDETEQFGVLSVKPGKTDRTQNNVFILFTVDRTGSMEEGQKMKYVKETFKNMIKYIADQDADIYIQVNIFNTEVKTCIEPIKVHHDNMEVLIEKIDAIEAEGSTAIDVALQSAASTMTVYMEQNPGHSVHHIFMTDGEATTGETNNGKLAAMVSEAYPNTFIGFGYRHNSTMLRRLSEINGASYDFVDNVEHTGLVYGDILHSLMYPALFDVSIRAKNALLYNWKTNTWVQELKEPLLVSETEKNYHFKCADFYQVEMDIYGKYHTGDDLVHIDNVDEPPPMIHGGTGIEIRHTYDLSKYVFRQAVLEKLFSAKSNDSIDGESECKKDMAELFSKMRKYMKESNNMDDPILKQLCDDLSIAYKTLGTEDGRILSCARQTGQGRQQSRNVSTPIPRQNVFIPRSNRCMGITPLYNDPDPEDQNEIDAYVPSENPISCYATEQATNTMRSMSQPYSP